ncbi:hypothetical protein A1D29_00015 [Pasteurellaceae bacterium Orientalotternb1]|nr:hypothetical protein A1D29_00015 [Pasteurellaceae bacterium Orientalotternb1]
MPIIVELKENRPGYADIEIKRWKGSADLEIAVQRNQDQHYFAQGEQWNPEPVWHKVSDLVDTGEALQGTLGPWLIDALVQQAGNTQYLLWAKSDNLTDRGVIRFLGNILASSAGGDSSREEDVREIVEPEIVTEVTENIIVEEPIDVVAGPEITETKVEEPLIQETPRPAVPETKKKSPAALITLLILLLAIAGSVAWWLLGKKPDEVAKKSPEVTACEIQTGGDELNFLQACLKTNPDTKQLLAIIENAKNAKACGIAQRLYANKAESGNAEIAFAYAKEYDAAFSKGDGCFKLDKESALYWYETGLAANPNNEEAKKRIEELKK